MSHACRLAGTAKAGGGTAAAVCRAALSLSASKTAFVVSSTNRGMPSVRSIMSCLTLGESSLFPVMLSMMAALSRSPSRLNGSHEERRLQHYRAVLIAVEAGRKKLLELVNSGRIHDIVMHRLEGELDQEELSRLGWSG
jgi:hypothetical protein